MNLLVVHVFANKPKVWLTADNPGDTFDYTFQQRSDAPQFHNVIFHMKGSEVMENRTDRGKEEETGINQAP